MGLSHDLISQFVKVTNDRQTVKKETIAYGTAVELDGKKYVRLDGSEMLTPVSSTADAEANERVTVLIKDHTATITGNASSPAARKQSVDDATEELDVERGRINTLVSENVTIKERLTASEADIDNLEVNKVSASELNAQKARIDNLETNMLTVGAADIKYATIESLEATNGEFRDLKSDYGTFKNATADNFEAVNGKITNLGATYASIDFANIGEAAVEKLFSDSGIIRNLVMNNSYVNGELVGVTIHGDLINANTLRADRLILQNEDGLYYQINVNALGEAVVSSLEEKDQLALKKGIHGSIIVAKSVTAEAIDVNDLVAFGATIGGFNISESAIYSSSKGSVESTTEGIYFDKNGQFAVGDDSSFIKYYKDDKTGAKKLEISADNMTFMSGSQKKSVSGEIESLETKVNEIGSNTEYISCYTDDNGKPCIELGENDTSFKVKITNEKIEFMDGDKTPASISNEQLVIEDAKVNGDFRFGHFVWRERRNGNMGLIWEEGNS